MILSKTNKTEDAEKPEEAGEEIPAPPEPEEEFYRKPRVIKRPNAPTKQEVEDHLPLHLPYRSWCPDCVATRSVLAPYKPSGTRANRSYS